MPVTETSAVKMLAGRLESLHRESETVMTAAATLRALAKERDALRKLSDTQAEILARYEPQSR
jgi:hypothetical protein